MALRPVFLPVPAKDGLVRTALVEFQWHPGLASSQKRKSIRALHDGAVQSLGIRHPLEVSSRSESTLGRALSAFNLQLPAPFGVASVESLYQGSKLFEAGGPYTDLYLRPPHEAKGDPRVRSSGGLTGFVYEGRDWLLEPKSLFYDWLYLCGLGRRKELWSEVVSHDGFTDIEFNPTRSVNCQARSAALFVALQREGIWLEAMSSPESFEELIRRHPLAAEGPAGARQGDLF